jgi:DNA-binding PadR family transcriptional regulator
MRTNPEANLTPLALVVLYLLQERAMHPYELHQQIRDRGIDYTVKVRAGSLYHTVDRLVRLGFIEQTETGRAGRRPERTVYAVTEVGTDQYHTNLRELVRVPREEYPSFAVAMEMFGSLDRDEALRLLGQRTVGLEARIAAHEQVSTSLTKRGLPRISTIEVEYAVALLRAELAWVGQLTDDIRSGDLSWTSTTEEPTP